MPPLPLPVKKPDERDLLEVWKPDPWFPNYEASSWGRVKSLARSYVITGKLGGTCTVRQKEKMLKLTPHRGYLVVRLVRAKKPVMFGVHQVVARAFHGPPAPGYVVDHIDTDKLNNVPSNLRHITNGANVKRHWDSFREKRMVASGLP